MRRPAAPHVSVHPAATSNVPAGKVRADLVARLAAERKHRPGGDERGHQERDHGRQRRREDAPGGGARRLARHRRGRRRAVEDAVVEDLRPRSAREQDRAEDAAEREPEQDEDQRQLGHVELGGGPRCERDHEQHGTRRDPDPAEARELAPGGDEQRRRRRFLVE